MASAVDPRLFDPRDRDVRPEITPQGVQQTYFHGRLFLLLVVKASTTYCHWRQGLLPAAGELNELLPGSSLSHPGLDLAWLHQTSRG